MQKILKSLILYTHLPSIDIVQDKVESVWCLEREVESHQEWMLKSFQEYTPLNHHMLLLQRHNTYIIDR